MPRLIAQRVRATLDGLWTHLTWSPDSDQTVPLALETWAAERPADPFLWFEGRTLSVGEVNRRVNQHAHAYRSLGLAAGDVVALLLENRPEYIYHFYGLAKLGVVAALLNPRAGGPHLLHTLTASGARLLVAGDSELQALGQTSTSWSAVPLPLGIALDAERPGTHAYRDWASLVETQPDHDPHETRGRRLGHVMAYIFTSGTTGLPKAAVVKHHRFYRAGKLLGGLVPVTSADCIYDCLPLYHASGNAVGLSLAVTQRARLALARRFSTRQFWADCAASQATLFVYIGEICRYLYQSPPSPHDRAHAVRRMVGNGLRADIWDPFCSRFGIEKVVEFYGATEGNAETANVLGTSGSCGVLLPGRMALARYDVERAELLRNRRGFCEPCPAGEPGLLLGAIGPRNEFAGYADRGATERKVLRDVFRAGDAWYDTGDLLRRDRLYRLYFVDRLGDTFRWKGENVSTQEVAEALRGVAGVMDATVYGVVVPGTEGRAGMAAVVLDGPFDPGGLFAALSERLPAYAQPRFLRLVKELDLTETFKHRKQRLQQEGFDPARVEDPLYAWDKEHRTYAPLTTEVREALAAGRWAM